MTHETAGPTIRTDGITTAAHDALGLPYVHGADSRRSDDAEDDDGVDEDSGGWRARDGRYRRPGFLTINRAGGAFLARSRWCPISCSHITHGYVNHAQDSAIPR